MQSKAFPLRAEQLAFRHHEVYTAYATFHRFIHSDPQVLLETIDGGQFDRESWHPGGEPVVECDKDIVLAGHSFGGCTVVSVSVL